MAFWNRRNNSTNEARDYVRATDVVSRPMAILLSFLTIVIIAALVFTLFWGVKWAYDRIRGNDTVTITTTTSTDSGNNSSGTNGTNVTVDDQQEFPGFLTDDEVNQASGQGNGSNSTSQNNTNTSSTTTQPTRIPNTGPDPDPEE